MLPDAPPGPIVAGEPAVGTYRGAVRRATQAPRERGIGRFAAWRRRKRWQWFGALDAEFAVGGAIVDAGLLGTAFLWTLDRSSGRLLADRTRVVPAPALAVTSEPLEGTIARCRFGREPLLVERAGDEVAVTGLLGGVALDLRLRAPVGNAATAICPVEGSVPGTVNVTQKAVTTAVEGTVEAGERRHELGTDAVGLLDYTHGLLARETRWRWGMGVGTVDGEPVGFNVVAGFNDGLENVYWVDGTPRRLEGAVRLEFPDGPDRRAGGSTDVAGNTPVGRELPVDEAGEASVDEAGGAGVDGAGESSDGGPGGAGVDGAGEADVDGAGEASVDTEWRIVGPGVDLRLDVEVTRVENRDYGVIASQYRQPVGTWRGTLAGRTVELDGVAEVHRARW